MNEESWKACMCRDCVAACSVRPGWPTPEEVERLMDQGHANRLMLDHWSGGEDGKEHYLLVPAVDEHGGGLAPFNPIGRCTFLTDAERCEIHESGAKPLGCRATMACRRPPRRRAASIVALWDGEAGAAAIARWRELTGCDGDQVEVDALDLLGMMMEQFGLGRGPPCPYTLADKQCGYDGPETRCSKTFADCRCLGNEARFGGVG